MGHVPGWRLAKAPHDTALRRRVQKRQGLRARPATGSRPARAAGLRRILAPASTHSVQRNIILLDLSTAAASGTRSVRLAVPSCAGDQKSNLSPNASAGPRPPRSLSVVRRLLDLSSVVQRFDAVHCTLRCIQRRLSGRCSPCSPTPSLVAIIQTPHIQIILCMTPASTQSVSVRREFGSTQRRESQKVAVKVPRNGRQRRLRVGLVTPASTSQRRFPPPTTPAGGQLV